MTDLQEYVQKQLEGIDITELVKQAIQEEISRDVKRNIEQLVKEECARLISEEFKTYLDKPVTISTGYDKKQTFESFDLLFKGTMKAEIEKSLTYDGAISKLVKQRIDRLYQEKRRDVNKAISEAIQETLKNEA